MADRKGGDFRRVLRSEDRLRDKAIARGVFLNTPFSSVIASLVSVTFVDQRFFAVVFVALFLAFFAVEVLLSLNRRRESSFQLSKQVGFGTMIVPVGSTNRTEVQMEVQMPRGDKSSYTGKQK